MDILHEPTFWVAAAFVIFVVAAFKKARALLIGALDNRTNKIKEVLWMSCTRSHQRPT